MIWINTNQYESFGELVWTCQDYFDNVSMTFSDSWTTLGLLLDYRIGRFFLKMLQTQACYQQVDKSIPFRSLQIPVRSLSDPLSNWSRSFSCFSCFSCCRWCCPSSPHFPSRAASPRRLHEFSGDIVKWSWDSISWPSLEVSSFVTRSAVGIFWHRLASFGIFQILSAFLLAFFFEFWILAFCLGLRACKAWVFSFSTWATSPWARHLGTCALWALGALGALEMICWNFVESCRVRAVEVCGSLCKLRECAEIWRSRTALANQLHWWAFSGVPSSLRSLAIPWATWTKRLSPSCPLFPCFFITKTITLL